MKIPSLIFGFRFSTDGFRLTIFDFRLILIAIILLSGCDNKDKYAGNYTVLKSNIKQETNISLELNSDGQGTWTTDTDTVSFRWEISKKKIFLHTKTGGVLAGDIADYRIHIKLPGVGEFTFVKK